MNTDNMTPSQLRALADFIEQEERDNPFPKARPFSEIDFQKFINFADKVRDEVARHQYDIDDEHFAWELIMTEVFGPKYFAWHNKQLK